MGRLRHRRRPRVADRRSGIGHSRTDPDHRQGLLVRPATDPGHDATGPAPIQADVANLLALAQHGAATGDPATLTSPDLQTADRNIDQYMLGECGYPQLQITATDTAYQGIPATISSGAVGITLDNQGREAHQALIVHINDGVTEPFTTLLTLPPEQRAQAATALGSVEVDPGQAATVFLRLTPGRYGAVDFLAQGTTRLDAPGNGDPHYQHGLQTEFTAT